MSDTEARTPPTPVEVLAARLDAILSHYGKNILYRRGVPDSLTVYADPVFPGTLPPEPPRDAADYIADRPVRWYGNQGVVPATARSRMTQDRGWQGTSNDTTAGPRRSRRELMRSGGKLEGYAP